MLEAGSNWITAWLDCLDHKFEVMRRLSSLKLQPSEYFNRQCLISGEPDESITAQIVEHLGANYFVWASDYPHIDASFNVLGEIRKKIASLPVESQGAPRQRSSVLRHRGALRFAVSELTAHQRTDSNMTVTNASDVYYDLYDKLRGLAP